MEEKSTFEGKGVKGVANYYLTHTKENCIKTLIILLIIIIVLLVLFGIRSSNLSKEGKVNSKQPLTDTSDDELITIATYEITERTDDKLKALVIFENKSGIEYIKTFDNIIISGNNKKRIAIDSDIERNEQYEFKIKIVGQNEEEIWTIDANEINNFIIDETEGYKYPTLKASGIDLGKSVELSYMDESTIYYSLDGEETWREYTDKITIKKETKVKATIKHTDNRISPIISKVIKINLAKDALPVVAYDGNPGTSIYINTGTSLFIDVDESAIGKKVIFTWGLGNCVCVNFRDELGNHVTDAPICNANNGISNGYASWYGSNPPQYAYIPNNTKIISFISGSSGAGMYVCEVSIE